MRTLIVIVLCLSVPGWARSHKLFPATATSVSRENETADSLGYMRYETATQMQTGIDSGRLVGVPITVAPRLPSNRRYVTPEAADFLLQLDAEFHVATGRYLIVSSAVRPADVQRRLCRVNRNAAPATGVRASSHERGTTVDLARRVLSGTGFSTMTRAEYRWLLWRLFYYRETGRILVIEERSCLHVFIGGRDVRLSTGTAGDSTELSD